MNCLYCNQVLMSEHINVRKDTAVCASCNSLFSIVQDYKRPESATFDIYTPPHGSWVRHQDDKIIVGSTTRSIVALFAVPVILLWCSGSVGGIVGDKFFQGDFDDLNWLIGLHLLLEILFFVSFVSMALAGKVEITMDKEIGSIFVGVWKIGWSQKFYWNGINCIKETRQKSLEFRTT